MTKVPKRKCLFCGEELISQEREQKYCVFCGKELTLEQERKQKLCSDCYWLRRIVKRMRRDKVNT